MQQDGLEKTVKETRRLYLAFLAAIPIYVAIIADLKVIGETRDHFLVPVLGPLFGVVAISNLVSAPRSAKRAFKRNQKSLPEDRAWRAMKILQVAFYGGMATFGLLLGVMDAPWWLVAPFLAISAGAIIRVFPSERDAREFLASMRNENN